VMTHELMQDFQISAYGLGHLSALYFYAYVAMQIPTGLLVDITVSGLINRGIMMGPMLLQPLVGKILDSRWSGTMMDGVRVYSLNTYEYGFSPMMVWIFLSCLLLLFTRETYCKQIC